MKHRRVFANEIGHQKADTKHSKSAAVGSWFLIWKCFTKRITNRALKREAPQPRPQAPLASNMPSVTAVLLAKDQSTAASRSPADERLFQAAVRGDVSAARSLLAAGASPNGFKDAYGTRPLQAAARGGSVRLCTALLDARAAVDAADSLGGTALSEAVRKVHPEVVQLLLDTGARRGQRDVWGRIPAEELLCGGAQSTAAEREVRKLLLGSADASAGDKAEHARSAHGHEEAVLAAGRMAQAAAVVAEAERAAGVLQAE